jgi:general secretion pathway protein E
MRAASRSKDWWLWGYAGALFLAALGAGSHWVAARMERPVPAWQQVFPEGPWLALFWGAVIATGTVFVLHVLKHALSWRDTDQSGVSSAQTRQPIAAAIAQVHSGVAAALAQPDPDVPKVLDEILRGALVVFASDIHFSPGSNGLKVTYRIDGILHDVIHLIEPVSVRVVGRIKVLSYLNTYSKEPQDGSLRRRVGEVELEARVSTLPANHGERVVLRLVRGAHSIPTLRQLGFDRAVALRLEDLLQKPQGMIYVSGPVGSGKTSTLYSALQHVHHSRGETTSLVTLEDPIEMQLSFATQTQINPKTGMGFAAALRSILRQDPGAIMLGEIRDKETAHIATQAGLTGHLILTTIHVQSAAGTFDRLTELEIERFVLSSSCLGALAQRLVRALCPECRKAHTPNRELCERFTELGCDIAGRSFFEPAGCPACEGRGYHGRLPVAELLVMSPALRAAVQRGAGREELQDIGRSEGMVTVLEAAMQHAEQGKTSLLEVLRVAG